MFQKIFLFSPFALAVLSPLTSAEPLKSGEAKYYLSPQQVQEICLRPSPIPNGLYSQKDLEEEKRLCDIDFYNEQSTGVCAKTWSTSPGLVIYNLTSGTYDSKKDLFESTQCPSSLLLKSFKSKAKFKSTMAEDNTSSTYSKASLVYYHLSRFMNTDLTVPVAVYREIDSSTHKQLSAQGLKNSRSEAIRNGWKRSLEAHNLGEKYYRKNLFFGETIQTVQGSLLKGSGEMVGPEINGINSNWGQSATNDFANTPAFMALKNKNPLELAIAESLEVYSQTLEAQYKKHKGGFFKRKNADALKEIETMKKTLPHINKAQMSLWMKELTEILILDTLLGQEDRIMNIDFKWVRLALDEKGKTIKKTLDAKNSFFERDQVIKTMGETQESTQLFQQLVLNDNDAAIIPYFTNFSKKAKLIEMISHIAPETYELMKALNNDLQALGDIYLYLKNTMNLSASELKTITDNSHYVFETLASKCEQGTLRFDLLTMDKIISGKRNEEKSSTCR